jgi:hypothetical protein
MSGRYHTTPPPFVALRGSQRPVFLAFGRSVVDASLVPTALRRRATRLRVRPVWWAGGRGRPFTTSANLTGTGSLTATAWPAPPKPEERGAPRAKFALIVWGADEEKHEPWRRPYRPSWTYHASEAEAYAAAECLPLSVIWSVVDVNPAPRTGGFDSRIYDETILALRRLAAEGAAERAARAERVGPLGNDKPGLV